MAYSIDRNDQLIADRRKAGKLEATVRCRFGHKFALTADEVYLRPIDGGTWIAVQYTLPRSG